jgi:arsenite-transporting ATPase
VLANVVDAPRSCVPLDTVSSIRAYLNGAPASSAGAFPRLKPGLPSFAPAPGVVLPHKIVFVAGKGGVGKTTIAASIALQLARANPSKRYTAISVDPAHSLPVIFETQEPPSNLTIESIDTRAKWSRFRDALGAEIERVIDALTPGSVSVRYDTEALQKLIEVAPPGADELFAITRLADLVADPAQELIVVDTAPTGHFLRLLDLPATAGEWIKEFMRILLRYRELIPPGSLGEELVRAKRALDALDETVRSERGGVVVVTRPERIVVAETRRLIDHLEQRGIAIASAIANYVTPESECPCDREMRKHELTSLADLGWSPVVIERRDEPPATLEDIERLAPLTSTS